MEVLKMIKYYNSNQVHKYGYRPQVRIPTAEEGKKIIEEMLKKMENKGWQTRKNMVQYRYNKEWKR